MVTGFESFKQWFSEYSEQYAIIGGTACDLLMSEEGMDFRATRDIDMVLIVESLTPQFGERFWSYIRDAGYGSSLYYSFKLLPLQEQSALAHLILSYPAHQLRCPDA